jgi:hypothetical protein
LSDELGLTVRRLGSYTELGKHIPLEVQQYIAGFFDGDGNIALQKDKCSVYCKLSQSHSGGLPPVFAFVQKYIHGKTSTRGVRDNEDRFRRPEHEMCFYEHECSTLLRIIRDHGTIKRPQADIALSFMTERQKRARWVNGTEFDEVAEQARFKLKSLKKQYADVEIDPVRLSDAYIAGLFDAEGHVGVNKGADGRFSKILSITQLGCPAILPAIREVMATQVQCSTTTPGKLRIMSTEAIRAFSGKVHPYLIMKQKELQLMQDFIDTTPAKRGCKRKVETADMDEYVARMKELKRQ